MSHNAPTYGSHSAAGLYHPSHALGGTAGSAESILAIAFDQESNYLLVRVGFADGTAPITRVRDLDTGTAKFTKSLWALYYDYTYDGYMIFEPTSITFDPGGGWGAKTANDYNVKVYQYPETLISTQALATITGRPTTVKGMTGWVTRSFENYPIELMAILDNGVDAPPKISHFHNDDCYFFYNYLDLVPLEYSYDSPAYFRPALLVNNVYGGNAYRLRLNQNGTITNQKKTEFRVYGITDFDYFTDDQSTLWVNNFLSRPGNLLNEGSRQSIYYADGSQFAAISRYGGQHGARRQFANVTNLDIKKWYYNAPYPGTTNPDSNIPPWELNFKPKSSSLQYIVKDWVYYIESVTNNFRRQNLVTPYNNQLISSLYGGMVGTNFLFNGLNGGIQFGSDGGYIILTNTVDLQFTIARYNIATNNVKPLTNATNALFRNPQFMVNGWLYAVNGNAVIRTRLEEFDGYETVYEVN